MTLNKSLQDPFPLQLLPGWGMEEVVLLGGGEGLSVQGAQFIFEQESSYFLSSTSTFTHTVFNISCEPFV